MTGTPGAAVFYSLVTLVLLAVTWVTLGRDLRADWLRHRLRALLDETGGVSAAAELRAEIELAIRHADALTTTRALLCSRFAESSPTTRSELETVRRLRANFAALVLAHALPFWKGWRQPEAVVSAMLASFWPVESRG
jgi:hypothetical protein